MGARAAGTALAAAAVLLGAALSACGTGNAAATTAWPEWDGWAERFVEADGRIVDRTFEEKSTSEGQSYGLFFALVANDRARFERILEWTSANLAYGRLGEKLPAWHWGKRDDGSWGIKDENAASDADLWIAYALLEAARLWNVPAYDRTARELLVTIRQREIVRDATGAPLLLPGPVGFDMGDGSYRMAPAYLPPFLCRYLAEVDPRGPWSALWARYLEVSTQASAAGIVPDLIMVDAQGRAAPDTVDGSTPTGAYDAVRVYMWAGMSGEYARPLLEKLKPFAVLTRAHGKAPERVDVRTGKPVGDFSPVGYAAAMLPFLSGLGDHAGVVAQRGRLRRAGIKAILGEDTNYYDESLILFGTGWADGRYRFDDRGRLHPAWSQQAVA